MKKTLLIFILFCSFAFVNAQNKTIPGSFAIKDLKDNTKLEFFTKAIENANFEELRLKDKTQYFTFENGFVLELTSASDLKNKGVQIDPNSYKQELDKDFQYPLFRVTNEGALVALYNSIPTKTELKMNSTK